ncbi:fimbrial protein [Burkholderia cenocepacia]|uniref:fimbrial protein n=1 Tax=Burkholderia cenocepacia TaxID=95486 RepID=UPI002AB6A7BE|nr:fimbrial protein [Burkholderia cenocepacia]
MRDTLIIALLFGVMASPAMGATGPCRLKDSTNGVAYNGPVVYTIDGYMTPEFNPSVPVGTVIDSRQIVAAGDTIVATCSSGGVQNIFNGQLYAATESVYHTYPTSVRGVGVRIRAETGSWWPIEFETNAIRVSSGPTPVIIEFVKTGPITAQGSLRGEIAGSWLRNKEFQMASYRVSGTIQIRPKVPTCSVRTKNIAVQMNPTGNTFTARDFGGVGGTTPERDFSIQLNCSGGDEGTSTNAYVTLTDNSNNGNRSNLLSLTPDSNATGVAIQILKDGKPLNFGPDSSSAGNPNQWKAGTIPQGQGGFTIPLTARYIQTGTLKGGTANAVATFTMSYQ